MFEAMSPSERAMVSADWLARLQAATSDDVWSHGFSLMHQRDNINVGQAGFTKPPAADGVVEIAYGVAPAYQGKGLATEAAQALVAFAFSSGRVRVVRAHTLPEANASTRVLTKCGFQHIGEVVDPEGRRLQGGDLARAHARGRPAADGLVHDRRQRLGREGSGRVARRQRGRRQPERIL